MKKRSAGTLIWMAALFVVLCLVLPTGKKAEAKMGDPIIPIQYTGTCGKQAKYSFDKKTSCMTISGQGAVTSASWNIPATLIKKVVVKDGITELPAAWMDGYTELTTLEIADSVTYIGEKAFYECTKLSRVKLPKNLRSLGGLCFYQCSALKTITIPASLQDVQNAFCESGLNTVTIAEGATEVFSKMFYKMTALKKVTLPKTIQKIGEQAFFGCSNLSEITIPSGVTVLGGRCFSGCRALKRITIPKSLQACGGRCFDEAGITEVTFEEGIEVVPKGLFQDAFWIKTVHFAESIKVISEDAFYNCQDLTGVVLPKGLKSIGDRAFCNCFQMEELLLPKTVTNCGDYCFDESGLKKLEFEQGTVMIPVNAASAATKLEKVIIPNTVKAVNRNAFYACESLTTITFPESVVSINCWAFLACTKLSTMYVKNPNVKFFEQIKAGTNLTVYGVANSTAQTYAEKYKMNFVTKWKQIKDTSIALASAKEETGKTITPVVTVKDGTRTLTAGKDYTLSYRNNKALGTAYVTITGTKNYYIGSVTKSFRIIPARNRTYTVGSLKYRLTNANANGTGTVSVAGLAKKSTSITIPQTVKIAGYTYQVTGIEKKAFYKQTSLKKIKIQSKKIKSIGSKAFYKISKKAKIRVPADCYKSYRTLVKKSGIKKGITIYK